MIMDQLTMIEPINHICMTCLYAAVYEEGTVHNYLSSQVLYFQI